jgi:hypothetical protein
MRIASWAYLVLLLTLFVAYLLTSDRFVFFSLVNYLAVYLFIPLPLVLIAALLWKAATVDRIFPGRRLPSGYGKPVLKPERPASAAPL